MSLRVLVVDDDPLASERVDTILMVSLVLTIELVVELEPALALERDDTNPMVSLVLMRLEVDEEPEFLRAMAAAEVGGVGTLEPPLSLIAVPRWKFWPLRLVPLSPSGSMTLAKLFAT